MAVLRRRGRHRDEPDDGGSGAADPDRAAVATAVLDAAEDALGTRPGLAEGPEPVLAGAGPDAYSFALATGATGWSGTLVARTSPAGVLGREAGWIRALAGAGYPVPEVVADRHEHGVVVFRPPVGMNLASAMVDDFMAVPQFLAAFGRLHARLHGLELAAPATDGDDEHPLDLLLERADADDVRAEVDAELTWLDKYRPGEGARPAVPCHGDLNPVHVYVADGDPSTAVPVNWTRARRAEAAFDVAATVTAFWTGPLFVDGTVQRTALKVIRDSLISAYLKAYGEASPDGLDDEALRYWQAFHVTALAVELARRRHGRPPGPWDPAANVSKPADALDDLRHRFRSLTDS